MPSAKRRKKLRKIINQFYQYDETTYKFAEVLSGRKEEIVIGYIQRDTAKLYETKPKTKIFLQKSYALHMDNSGHFTGVGYGRHAHNDKHPLTLEQISQIPNIIKTAKKNEVFFRGIARGANRFIIVRKIERNCLILIEVSKRKDRVDLVTAYNITNAKTEKILKKRNSR